ncbi:MAG TPA: hypothetical protein VGF86_07330 [Candidatus Tumulicola sp.]
MPGNTRFTMHPFLATFLKLTALIAIGIVALLLVGFLLKIVLIAALVAAVAAAGIFIYTLVRRRSGLPVIR